MTTIAANATGMAADTQLTGEYKFRVQKIHALADGSIVGGAGDWGRAYAAIQWLLGGCVGEAPRMKGANLLILRPDGSLWIVDNEWPAFPLLDKVASIGCGAQAAMVAMASGKAPADAVKEVCKLDAYSGDPVQFLALEPRVKRNGCIRKKSAKAKGAKRRSLPDPGTQI